MPINKYTIDDINNINKNGGKLILIGKKVLDISELLDNHPGGNNCLLKKLGTDCSKDINYHSKYFINSFESERKDKITNFSEF